MSAVHTISSDSRMNNDESGRIHHYGTCGEGRIEENHEKLHSQD
jgi:hypothetical protein